MRADEDSRTDAFRRGSATTAPPHDDGTWGIPLFAGTLALTAIACLDAALTHNAGWRLALLTVAVGVVAERTAESRSALGCAVFAFAVGNGFLQNHNGVLALDRVDYPFALGLLGATALGMCAGQIRLARQRWRLGQPRAPWPHDTADADQVRTPDL